MSSPLEPSDAFHNPLSPRPGTRPGRPSFPGRAFGRRGRAGLAARTSGRVPGRGRPRGPDARPDGGAEARGAPEEQPPARQPHDGGLAGPPRPLTRDPALADTRSPGGP